MVEAFMGWRWDEVLRVFEFAKLGRRDYMISL